LVVLTSAEPRVCPPVPKPVAPPAPRPFAKEQRMFNKLLENDPLAVRETKNERGQTVSVEILDRKGVVVVNLLRSCRLYVDRCSLHVHGHQRVHRRQCRARCAGRGGHVAELLERRQKAVMCLLESG